MMSILGRMNPAICLGGSSSAVYAVDDGDVVDVASGHSSRAPEGASGGGAGANDSAGGGSFATDGDESSNDVDNGSGGRAPRRTGGGPSFGGCIVPPSCSSRYLPDDDATLPLVAGPSDAAGRSLDRTVPGLLARIAPPPPPSATEIDGTSPRDRRRALREFRAGRTEALRALHDLTARGGERNRVPLATRKELDVLGVLSAALLASASADREPEKATIDGKEMTRQQQSKARKSADDDRRLICWTLNNLSVPYENKAAMALGEHSAALLRALTEVIRADLPEAYLCCICLYNLTFLADAVRPVTFYVPSAYRGGKPPYSSPPRSRSAVVAGGSRSPGGSSGRPPTSPFSRSRSLQAAASSPARSPSAGGKSKLWSPTALEGGYRMSEVGGMVLGNPSSLVRVVERMMLANAPFLSNTAQSVQGQAVRWACGFVRNVTYAGDSDARDDGGGGELSGSAGRHGTVPDESVEEICALLSATEVPRLVVGFVRDSPRRTVAWTKDSLEDICLGALCNLAQWPSSREALLGAGAVECLGKIEGLPGIHGYRARAIRCSLGALPMQFG